MLTHQSKADRTGQSFGCGVGNEEVFLGDLVVVELRGEVFDSFLHLDVRGFRIGGCGQERGGIRRHVSGVCISFPNCRLLLR